MLQGETGSTKKAWFVNVSAEDCRNIVVKIIVTILSRHKPTN